MSEKNGMRIGKITQTAWQRSVRKQLHTEDNKTLFGPSPWETCSGLETEAGGYVWADAHAAGDDDRTGYYAVYHAAGELAARGVRAEGASVHVMLPTQGSEEKLGGLAVGVDRACSELDMQVTAFQGEVNGAVRQTVIFASAAGTGKLPLSQKKRVQADCSVPKSLKKGDVHREIVQCGYAGLEGTLRILGESREDLEERFVSTFLDQAEALTGAMVRPEQLLNVFESDSMAVVRQIGSGGILAALWELSETAHIGFEIDMPQIALKQETVEICEFYRLNPYLMTSAGSYLILTSEAEAVVRVLEDAGVSAVRLGAARDQNARVIRNGEEIRYLDRPAPDELERWRAERLKQ